MNRATRRRQSRAHEKEPVLVAGENMVAASLGQKFEARPSRDLPPKQPLRHRWVAVAAYVLSDDQVEGAFDPDKMKFLDNENLMTLSIGCYDCEMPLSKRTGPNTPCPGDPMGNAS